MLHTLIIAIGGGIGAALRHLTGQAMLRVAGPGFPYGTMTVNIIGSFAMGFFIAWLSRKSGASAELRLFFATGVLGGFTTFSAFALDTSVLYQRGDIIPLAVYVLGSVVISIAALFLGLWLARSFG